MQKPNLVLASSTAAELKIETFPPETPSAPEPPRPLIRALPPATPFPVKALGPLLDNAAKAINNRVQAPLPMCCQSVLAAATLAVQGHADIQLPTAQIKPISNYFVTVAESGDRKTAADNEALQSVVKRERELSADKDEKLPSYQNAIEAWEAARAKVKKDAKGNQAAIKIALNNIGPRPISPLEPLLTCAEPTYEGLVKTLAVGQPSIGLFADEGGQFIGGHAMNEDAMLRTAAGLSSAWDGKTIKRVRASDGVTILHGRRIALHIMAQPDVAAMMLANRLLLNQGLLSRCLVSAPDSIAGTRLWKEPSAELSKHLETYNERLLTILRRPLPLAPSKINELAPRIIMLTAEAREMWIAFADKIESQIKPNGLLIPVKGLANKLPEHSARIASVIELANALTATSDVAEIKITEDQMASGEEIATYYANEALRLFEASQVNAELLKAQNVLDWMLSPSWGHALISLPDIYQYGPNSIRDKQTASKMVAILDEHGWLTRVKGGAQVGDHYRQDAWLIYGKKDARK
jgi:hypothetical protein